MGFGSIDLNSLKQALIAKAEELAGKDGIKDGEFTKGNKAEEFYIGELLTQVTDNGEVNMTDAEKIASDFGLQLSSGVKTAKTVGAEGVTEPAGARAPRRAGTNITINITININVVVNGVPDLSDMISQLIKAITEEGGTVEQFIIALIQKFRTNTELDTSKLEEYIRKLIDEAVASLKQDNKDQTQALIDELNAMEERLSDLIKEQMRKAFGYLQALGISIGNLGRLVENCNKNQMKQMRILQQIYEMIFKLKNDFGIERLLNDQRYRKIMEKLGTLDSNDTKILNKLQLLYNMLLALQKTAGENSDKLDELLDKSDEILDAIDAIEIPAPEGYDDSEIRRMLNEILTNQAVQGAQINDIQTKVNEFKTLMENLKNFIKDKSDADKKEILDAISHIKPGDIDLEWLKQILARMEGKLDGVAANQVTIIANQETMLGALEALSTKVEGIETLSKEIKSIVEKLRNCDCEHVDWDALWEKVEQLLEKYRCCCGEDNNEGAIDPQEVEDLISFARGVSDMIPESDESTDIKNTQSHKNDNAIHYDLNGHQISPNKPGLHIVNGKKVVVK